ncbi:hypothetical protein PMAC_000813 [Pneumocystis sp. 'macacae']|nr:hypothetical protein PMAC_000813 [Pneumocystis sp. 'macacae']
MVLRQRIYKATATLHCLPLHLTYQTYRFFHVTSSRCDLSALASTVLHTVHDTGVPWWATIPLTTLFIRTIILPVVFWSRNRMIRYLRIKPLIKAWEFQTTRLNGLDVERLNQKRNELFRRHSCHPIGFLVLPLVQIPLFFVMTFALRGMSAHEGIGWIQDLTVSDPIGFLPVCLGLIGLINIEVLFF